jgi:glycine cleavage system aminomethyltransferase T
VSFEREVAAIRASAAWCSGAHVSAVRISGQGAFDAVDAVCPRELYIQDGNALHTLFLDDRARPLADVYVCADGEDFLVVGETRGLNLADYLRDAMPTGTSVQIQDLAPTHEIVSLNGPYAWEVLSEVLSPEIIGLPYLGFFHAEDVICLRAGKTGEFGYDLLVPREHTAMLAERVLDVGTPFELCPAGLEALDTCALENWFFNIRREGESGATPIELQLQWRVSYGKSYPGSAALLEQRRKGPERRAVLVVAESELARTDAVWFGGRSVGELLAAGRSPTLDKWLGIALIEVALAHSGLAELVVQRGQSRVPLVSVSPPPINNRSLFVDPQRHSYHTRARDTFPPIHPTP